MSRISIVILTCALYFDCVFCTPRVGDGMKNVTQYAGEDVNLTCTMELTGKPSPIAWKKDGKVITTANNVHADKNKYGLSTTQERRSDGVIVIHNTLLVKNVEITDAGQFTCFVMHQQHVTKSAWLIVLRKILPTPICDYHPKRPQLGDIVATTCKTEPGEPPVRLRMYQLKPTGEMGMVKDGYQSKNQLNLSFDFTITRENVGDMIVCEVSITRLGLRGLKRCTIDLLGGMIHEYKGRKKTVRVVPLDEQPTYVGETACFLCHIYDHEEANVAWSLGDRIDVTSNISRQYQYCFKDIQLTDNGKDVTCNISSEHMVFSNSVKVKVIEHEKTSRPTKEPVSIKEMATPDLYKMVPSNDAPKEDTLLDLMQIKILLVLSLFVIIILLVAIIQLVLRSRSRRGGEDFSRLNTISDKTIDQRYHDICDDNNGEYADRALIKRISDDTENESETST